MAPAARKLKKRARRRDARRRRRLPLDEMAVVLGDVARQTLEAVGERQTFDPANKDDPQDVQFFTQFAYAK